MARGGSRRGAGRKSKYDFKLKAAIAIEVGEVIRSGDAKNRRDAIKVLQETGRLDSYGGFKDRYLTPAHMNAKDVDVLQNNPPSGIVHLLRILPPAK